MKVYVFLICGTFRDFSQLQTFVEDTFNPNGERIPSQFAREVGLQLGEAGQTELFFDKEVVSVRELLKDAIGSETWLTQLSKHIQVDAAICVYDPITIENPYGCGRYRARFRGAFEF